MDERNELVPSHVAEFIQETVFWFEQRIETLSDIANSTFSVALTNGAGDQINLNEEESRAFKAGVKTAIDLIGKFPLSLDKPVTSPDVDEVIGR